MGRTLAACVLPALVVSAAWLRVEDQRLVGEGLAVAALAVAAALPPRAWQRALAAVVAAAGAAQVAFGVHAWELLPFRDRQVLAPVGDRVRLGVESFYEVLLPFEPGRHPEMHALVLAAIFGFVFVTSQLVAARKPVGAVAATIAGAGWPATLIGTDAVAIGAVALAAALSIPLVLRVRSVRSLAAGAALAGLVVVAAAWASSSTTAAREAALDWEAWSIRGDGPLPVTGVRFAWDSNYDGISFPPDPTVVLTIDGPERAHYWRTSTLGLFTDDHWFENLAWVSRIEGDVADVPDGPLTPSAAANRDNWLAQEIEIRALVDDRLAAAGTPVALDSRQLGTVFLLTDGVLRMREPLSRGLRYRVWSYAPDPAPAVLVRSKPRYPDEAAGRFLRLESRSFMRFGAPGREAAARALFDDPSYSRIALYQPLYAIARRVAGRAGTPYEAVLALEGWFRQRGGFTYDEHPARVSGPPLVAFVTRTKEGYCQHYAGAMALMLRMLGIPARVAVGFTSGSRRDGKWVVTDHDAHAWVEAWFAGIGWVPFDPTPGRGTFGGNYSLASDSPEAVNALRRGQLTQRRVGDDFRDTAGLSTMQVARDERAPSFAAAVLLLGALWVLVVGGGKAVVRRARLASRDPRRSAAASRRELEAFLRDQRIDVPPSATLDELRRTVGAELGLDGRAFATAVARARFGPPEGAHRHAQAARRELRVLLRRMRLELSLWARFRGLLSLRSLQRGALR